MANAYGQLNSLQDKLLSEALPVEVNELPDSVISNNPPQLAMSLPDNMIADQLSCFASGQGRIPVIATEKNSVSMVAPKAFNSRRFRYNCTYPVGDGRFYWFSQPWLDLSKVEE